jgi:putative membrane protein
MKKRIYFAFAIAAFAWSACDTSNNDNNNNADATNGTDVSFMANTAYTNHAEIALGQLAATRALNDSVKMFGQMMVDEHTTAQSDLESLANQLKVNLPDSFDNDHQQLKTKLMSLSGSKFDSTYIVSQINDHTNAITMFQLEINNGKAVQAKNYANKYLSHIKMHLQRADSIAKMLNDTTQTPIDTTNNSSGPQ